MQSGKFFLSVVKLLDGAGEQGLTLNLATCRTLIRGFTRREIWTAAEALESMIRFGWVPVSNLSGLINEGQSVANSEKSVNILKQEISRVACQEEA